MARESPQYTDDAVFNGKVLVRQRRDGYRFSLDALLLAWYASALPGTRVLELGTGCGVVSLALAYKRPSLVIDAVEIQKPLADLARYNTRIGGLDAIAVHQADLRTLSGPEWDGVYDLVLSNPPYRAVGRGRLNPNPEKARARHELLCTLDDVIACAARALTQKGSAALVLLAERERDLEDSSANHSLRICHRCLIRPYSGRPPNLLLALLRRGEAGEPKEDELVVYERRGKYTTELKAVLDGAWEQISHPLRGVFPKPDQKE